MRVGMKLWEKVGINLTGARRAAVASAAAETDGGEDLRRGRKGRLLGRSTIKGVQVANLNN